MRERFQSQRRMVLIGLGASMATSVVPTWAQQDFPNRPITLVVPYSAGGPTDISARLLAEELGKVLGTQIVVDNRPSAGGLVAASSVAQATPNGYTLLLSVGTIVSTNPSLYEKLPYKVSDLTPIAQYARWPYVVSASPTLPVKNVQELIAYARQKPEGLSFATVGHGTQSHIIAEWVGRRLGIKIQTVPYKGVSQALGDLISGRVELLTDGVSTAVQNHQAGKVRIIASMGDDRFFMPEGVGTFVDAGYPDLVAYSEFGVMAPAGTPELVIRKLYEGMARVLGNPSVQARMRERGEGPALSASPSAYGERIQQETVRWAELIKPLNLKLTQ